MGARVPRTWSIVTPEYPPDCGGIGDYIALVAGRLAELGDDVAVFTRSPPGRTVLPGVRVEYLPDDFGPESRRFLAASWAKLPRDAVVLVQYTPHGFRLRGMNVPFTRWLGAQPQRRWLMVHEALFPFSRDYPARTWVLAGVTRLMLRLASSGAERVFVSTPAWETFVERWGAPGRRPEWLPIPATLAADPASLVAPVDPREPTPETVVHFGTYGAILEPLLKALLVPLLASRRDLELLLLGRNSESFRAQLLRLSPGNEQRIVATGQASPELIATELSRAGVAVFPFIEGATARRTSLMAALSVGAAIVTNDGGYSEALWQRSGAVGLYPSDQPALGVAAVERLLGDPVARSAQRAAASRLYADRFHLEHVVTRLRRLADAPRG